MAWKNQLEILEQNKNWQDAIDFLQKIIFNAPNNVEAYVRIIYLLHNLLLEEQDVTIQNDVLMNLLKKYFHKSLLLFGHNAEYLFFIGKILHIAEWYFGINEHNAPENETLAFEMQKRAYELELNNLLYELAYRFTEGNMQRTYILAKTIFEEKPEYINWLHTKGFPGEYVLQILVEPLYKEVLENPDLLISNVTKIK